MYNILFKIKNFLSNKYLFLFTNFIVLLGSFSPMLFYYFYEYIYVYKRDAILFILVPCLVYCNLFFIDNKKINNKIFYFIVFIYFCLFINLLFFLNNVPINNVPINNVPIIEYYSLDCGYA